MTSDCNRIHIGHVIFRLDVGGLENGLVNLINTMPPERFQHSIICIDRSTNFQRRIQHDDVRIEEIRRRPGKDPAALLRIYRVLRDLRPQILHTRNLAALDALLPAFVAGVPIRVHGEHGRGADDIHGTNARHRLLRRIHAPLVTRFVALSEETRLYLKERININDERISHIYNGVDVKRFRPSEGSCASRSGLGMPFEENDVVFGFVGRLDSVKNPGLLLSAFAEVIHSSVSSRSPRLAIVGDGPLRDQLESMVSEMRLGDYCWIAGARNDVPQLMREFDVFVSPSLVEGISNTILEAMATGLPVIATNVGGNPELVNHSDSGLLTASEDVSAMFQAMSQYLEDPDLRERHGQTARDRAVMAFSIETMVEAYRKLYEALIVDHTSRRLRPAN